MRPSPGTLRLFLGPLAVGVQALTLAVLTASPLGAQQGSPPASAAESTSTAATVPIALFTQVRAAVAQRWGVAPESLDLQWGPLPAELTGQELPFDGVELSGTGAAGYWIATVPTALGFGRVRLRAGTWTVRQVAARQLERETILTEVDMRAEEIFEWGAPSGPADWVEPGWITHRLIQEGSPLEAPAVTPPAAVVSGQPVDIIWQKGTVSLRLRGQAAGTAALGEQVLVRTGSGQRLLGVVQGPGLVNVTFQIRRTP